MQVNYSCDEEFDVNLFFDKLENLSPAVVSKEQDHVIHSNQTTWFLALRETLGATQFKKVFTKLNSEIGRNIIEENLRPSKDRLFEWTKSFPISELRAVILGREPDVCQQKKIDHHWTQVDIQASGLAFQPLDKDNISPSLKALVKSVLNTFHDDVETSLLNHKEHEFHLGHWTKQENVLLLNCYTSIEVGQKLKTVKNSRAEYYQKQVTTIKRKHGQWWVITEALLKYIFEHTNHVLIIHTLDKKFAKPSLDRLFKHKNNVARVIPVRYPSHETTRQWRKSGLKDIGQGLQRCNEILEQDFQLKCIRWWDLSLWKTQQQESEKVEIIDNETVMSPSALTSLKLN